MPDAARPCPRDLVNRQFTADRPDQLWVVDFTYVSAWQGWLYVAFVTDAFARRIVGWQTSASMTTDLRSSTPWSRRCMRASLARARSRTMVTAAANTSQ